MGKLTIAPKNLVDFHPIAIALAKADAARWLLTKIDNEEVGDSARDAERLTWVEDMAMEALKNALSSARAEFVKAVELHREGL